MKHMFNSDYQFHRTFNLLYKELSTDFDGIERKNVSILDVSKTDRRLMDHLMKTGYDVQSIQTVSDALNRFVAVVAWNEINLEALRKSGVIHQLKNVVVYLINVDNEFEFENALNEVTEQYQFAILTKKSINQSQKHFLFGKIGERTFSDWRLIIKYDCLVVE